MGEHGDRADHPSDASRRRLVRSLTGAVGRNEQPLRLDLMPDRPYVVVAEILADRDGDRADRCDQPVIVSPSWISSIRSASDPYATSL